MDGRVPLIVEIKSTEQVETVCLKVYDLLRRYPGDYCIESMNPLIVSWFYKKAPHVMRGQLATRFESGSKIASAALGCDLRAQGRTIERLGRDNIRAILDDAERGAEPCPAGTH